MSVQELVLFVRQKILPRKEEPDLFWTGVMTAFLTLINLLMVFYFLFSETLFR